MYYEPSIIFTCTTYFDFKKQDRWETFCRAIDSIQTFHSPETLQMISKWIIINEYSEFPTKDWTMLCKQRYPFLEVIQKTEKQKGQAASMNIILDKIRGYDYWIHWEETWYCRKPCIDRMIHIMSETDISQLQCTQLKDTPNWLDSKYHRQSCNRDYCKITPSPHSSFYMNKSPYNFSEEYVHHWPLYSLLPSINRVNDYSSIGYFCTDPKLWPVKFEWDFARRWLKAGNKKAVLPDGPVVRDNQNHTSTYS